MLYALPSFLETSIKSFLSAKGQLIFLTSGQLDFEKSKCALDNSKINKQTNKQMRRELGTQITPRGWIF